MMAVRREKVQIVFDPVTQEQFDAMALTMRRRSKIVGFMLEAPRDPVWGVPVDSGPGPHVWGGDQA